jgi:hypothetical protein
VHFNEIKFVAISCFFVNSVKRLSTTPIEVKYTVIHKSITEASVTILKAYGDKKKKKCWNFPHIDYLVISLQFHHVCNKY